MTEREKNEFDRAAEREGIALDRLHRNTKDKRLRNETLTYNEEIFKRLFKKCE